MEKILFDLAAGNGIWAGLYVFLFIYVLYDSRNREKQLRETIQSNQKIISETVEKLKIVEEISADTKEIRAELARR